MLRSGFFRHDVERGLRFLGVGLVVGAFATTLAWGYEQRLQARAWRELACSYRVADLAGRAKFLGLDDRDRACDRLQSLGLGVRTSGVSFRPVHDPRLGY